MRGGALGDQMKPKPQSAKNQPKRNPRSRGKQSQQQVPLSVLIGLVVFLLALVGVGAWALLREGPPKLASVVVLVNPQPETIFINGERQPYPEGGGLELPVGEHMLEVAVPGYALLEVPFSVEPSTANSYEFILEVLPGILTIRSNAPAEIQIDGEVVGTTPVEGLELEPGEYTLTADGGKDYQPREQQIEVKGYREQQKIDIELIRSWSLVTVDSVPPGARVLNERDELVGLAGQPIKVYASETPYEWTLSGGPAFEPIDLFFEVVADKDINLGEFELDLDHASIKVESEPFGLTIAVNGRVTEHKTPHVFSVPPGREYEISLRSNYHEAISETVDPEPGRSYEIMLEPVAKTGRLKIETVPRGVKVFQGEELLGLTPLELEREAGEHVFIFRRLGYLESDAKVTVRPDLTSELNLTLERN